MLYNCYIEDKYSKNFLSIATEIDTQELEDLKTSLESVVDHENTVRVYEVRCDPYIKMEGFKWK